MIRDGQIVRGQTTVLDAILQIRNETQHATRILDNETGRFLQVNLCPLMCRLVEGLDSLSGFQLVAISESNGTIALHGPDLPEVDESHHCLLVDPAGTSQSLYPLAMLDFLGDTIRKPNQPPIDLLLYDGRQEKRLRFLGLSEAQERKDLYSDFSSALERKFVAARLADPIDRWDRVRIRDAFALRQLQFEADGRATAPVEVLLPRPAIDERLTTFLDSRSAAALLSGPPGAGRSTLVCATIRRLLAAETPAIMVSADILVPLLRDDTLETALPTLLAIDAPWSEILAAGGRPTGKPHAVVAIDGLENVGSLETISQILMSVEQFCRHQPSGTVKILVTAQSHILGEFLNRLRRLTRPSGFKALRAVRKIKSSARPSFRSMNLPFRRQKPCMECCVRPCSRMRL